MVVKQTRFGKLKKVSGRLLRMLGGTEQTTREEAPMPRLLVVDDEESICFSMSEYFALHGYKVDTARELDEAEKLIETALWSRCVSAQAKTSIASSSGDPGID